MWEANSYRKTRMNSTFENIVINTGAAMLNICENSSVDGIEIAKALYPFLFNASVII